METAKRMQEEEQAPPPARSRHRWVWLVVIILVAAVAFVWLSDSAAFSFGERSEYQAVFLTNDQVYFGKLSRVDSQYPILRDVWYIQVTQALQPIEQGAEPETNISLVKLGGELHGPEDEMILNRDHILFFEDLKADSQVVQGIEQIKEGQGNN